MRFEPTRKWPIGIVTVGGQCSTKPNVMSRCNEFANFGGQCVSHEQWETGFEYSSRLVTEKKNPAFY